MTARTAVVFGAGSIGRGLLGQLLAEDGFVPVLVEPVATLRRDLAAARAYTVRLTGRRPAASVVTGYDVLAPGDHDRLRAELAECLFAATAVGGPHLPEAAQTLACVVSERQTPLPLLLCENWPDAAGEMTRRLAGLGVGPERVACVGVSVERMVRADAGLNLLAESCETLYVDGRAWPGRPPAIRGFEFVEALEPYYKRKLFTNNAGHALLAYEGARRGCTTLCQALAHDDVAVALHGLLAVASEALHRAWGLGREALAGHVHNLVTYRYANEALGDTVARVGRQPLRKLGPAERLTGLLRLVERHELDASPVYRVMAAALCYDDPLDAESVEMQRIIAGQGPGAVLESVCGIRPGEPAYRGIVDQFEHLGD